MWHPFRAVVRLSINIDILKAPMCLGGAGLPVDKLKLQGKILACFPKHCEWACFGVRRVDDVGVWSYYGILERRISAISANGDSALGRHISKKTVLSVEQSSRDIPRTGGRGEWLPQGTCHTLWVRGIGQNEQTFPHCHGVRRKLAPENPPAPHRPYLDDAPRASRVPSSPFPSSLRPFVSTVSVDLGVAVKQNKLRLRQNWLVAKQWPWDAPYDQIKDCKTMNDTPVRSNLGTPGGGGYGYRTHSCENSVAKCRRPSHSRKNPGRCVSRLPPTRPGGKKKSKRVRRGRDCFSCTLPSAPILASASHENRKLGVTCEKLVSLSLRPQQEASGKCLAVDSPLSLKTCELTCRLLAKQTRRHTQFCCCRCVEYIIKGRHDKTKFVSPRRFHDDLLALLLLSCNRLRREDRPVLPLPRAPHHLVRYVNEVPGVAPAAPMRR